MPYTSSLNGIAFLENEEGPRGPALKAYWDETGWAIGYGNHTYDTGLPIKQYDTITAAYATTLLNYYVNTQVLPYLNSNVTPGVLNQNQVDALISYMYNGAPGVLTNTGLSGFINKNANDQTNIRICFMKVRKGHVTRRDLTARRNRELDLYFNANYGAGSVAYGAVTLYNTVKAVKSNIDANVSYSIKYANDKSIVDLATFINFWHLNITPVNLMAFADNQNTMFTHYKRADRDNYKNGVVTLLAQGTPLKVPNNVTTSRSVYNINQTLARNDNITAFLETQMQNLLFNPAYKKINTLDTYNNFGEVFKRNETFTILWWSRALNPDETQLIDITKFVMACNQSNGMNGGNFQLRLPKITYSLQQDESAPNSTSGVTGQPVYKVVLSNLVDNAGGDYEFFIEEHLTHIQNNFNNVKPQVYVSPDDNDYLKENNGEYFERTNSLFADCMQKNDLIFIAFERIQLDTQSPRKTIATTPASADGFKWIDAKLLPNCVWDIIGLVDTASAASGESGMHYEVSVQGRDFSKALIDDGVQFFSVTYGLKALNQVILNSNSASRERFTVSNVDNKKLTDYQRNLTYASNMALQDTGFNFFVPHSISDFLIYIFTKLTHLTVTATNNLFTAYKNSSFIISSSQAPPSNNPNGGPVQYQRVPASGIWQITKLVIDPEISKRMVLDLGFINDSGSLLNFVRKICQRPFVEFYTDTYGDQFYYIVRKPPFNQSGFKTNYCLNIYEDEVLEDSLDYSDEVYSFYQLNPLASIIKDPATFMQVLPAVVLPEYLQIFGNKVLKVDTNYLDFEFSVNSQSTPDANNIIAQYRQDMDFMIETTAYLPFTRVGRITLRGDRRIKKGINIRHMATGEVFYVEGVSNSINFRANGPERMTTLEVSHGIVEADYNMYFQLVNLFRNTNGNQQTWTVNVDVLNYFLQRKQKTNA